eukprot:TRINITY_DN6571_c0_g1_i1.p1 TRINITY_DN6571_c0_g1~~TRINITY_DN6571_c0_g1_i1.p1  ORF type:complete len:397 (-),score=71.60 TRINITY_DN6571_c0_g1_i1:22-1212(-)
MEKPAKEKIENEKVGFYINRKPFVGRRNWEEQISLFTPAYCKHENGNYYWQEFAYYEVSPKMALQLTEATQQLHGLCLKAVDHIISNERSISRLCIPDKFAKLVVNSWKRNDFSLYGRFDLSLDSEGIPKLLEYNADTPTSVVETATLQKDWRSQAFPGTSQCNQLREMLIARWKDLKISSKETLYFGCIKDTEDDTTTTLYLRDTAKEAGINTKHIYLEDIGWDGVNFVDLDNKVMKHMFKLYPWEWFWKDHFGDHLVSEPMQMIEPAWKILLSNKAILPILWEMFPNHPNLLPSFFSVEPAEKLQNGYVSKPFFSREGANLTVVVKEGTLLKKEGSYGTEGLIYQEFCPLPLLSGKYVCMGTWIVGDKPAGLSFREDDSYVTNNLSQFVPHLIA